ncbi:MAG: bifunctional folylpolyglutamate synthase/dihydrofolate synthase, partial [Lachnospiraceae bacterium]
MNYREAVDTIESIPQIGKEPGVVRSKRLLSLLGNPDKDLKIIHIAGTNGKGSTCMYITRILRESGYSVGTFTSPHLIKLNERIMVNEKMIDDHEFAVYFSKVWEVVKNDRIPGYFDVLLAMAMLIYRDRQVDYVVLETGLGGRLDGSNAVLNKILTVITSISLDHCALLGNTVEQIAREKAGIIVPNVPVVWDNSCIEAGKVIEQTAKDCNAPSYAVEKSQYRIVGVDGKRIDF